MTSTHPRIQLDVILEEESTEHEVEVLREGLLASPHRLPTRYFYDDRGSELFERITELDEYYQTRTERALLEQAAPEIARTSCSAQLVEVGSGAASKTRVLLDALSAQGCLRRYVPLDVSEGITRRIAEELVEEYPELEIHGIVGDFLHNLDEIPNDLDSLVVFLGGTIGNLEPEPDAREFLASLGDAMRPGDWFLLGTDLIKDRDRLEAAYNDSQGVTAAFNRNLLRVINRAFDGDFEPEAFAHRAIWNEEKHRIEMWLVPLHDTEVRIRDAEIELDLAEGEGLLTEISTKYDRAKVAKLLDAAGFELERWFTDSDDLFGLSLSRLRSRS